MTMAFEIFNLLDSLVSGTCAIASRSAKEAAPSPVVKCFPCDQDQAAGEPCAEKELVLR